MKELLIKMRRGFDELKKTRLEMLKSMVFKTAAKQLEPVENLMGDQMVLNESVVHKIAELNDRISKIEGLSNAN